jgi:hypothetical protein
MKKNKMVLAGVLSVLMVFALLSCSNSGGGTPTPPPGEKPVEVNMTLPKIDNVAEFPGRDVSTDTDDEVKELLLSIFDTIMDNGEDFSQSFSRISSYKVQPVLQSIARSVQKESILENIKNEEIIENVFATGFVQGNITASAKDDDDFLGANGDYLEGVLKSKLAVDFKETTLEDLFMAGKATFDGDVNFKFQTTGIDTAKVTGSLMFDNNYVLSVSNNGIGMKLEMIIKMSKKNVSLDINFEDFEALIGKIEDLLNNSFTITFNVYNKAGQKQNPLCRTFKSVDDIFKYLGIEYSDIF